MSVIDFQKAREARAKAKEDSAEQSVDEFIADFSASAIFDIIDVLDNLDFVVEDNPDCIVDLLMLDEMLKGLMHRIKKTPYPMHKIADTVFQVEDKIAALELIRSMMDEYLDDDEDDY